MSTCRIKALKCSVLKHEVALNHELQKLSCLLSSYFSFDLGCEIMSGDGIGVYLDSDEPTATIYGHMEDIHASLDDVISIIERGDNVGMEKVDFYNNFCNF